MAWILLTHEGSGAVIEDPFGVTLDSSMPTLVTAPLLALMAAAAPAPGSTYPMTSQGAVAADAEAAALAPRTPPVASPGAPTRTIALRKAARG